MKTRILKLVVLAIITCATIYNCSPSDDPVLIVNDDICSNYSTLSTLEVKLIHEMTNGYKSKQLTAINNDPSTGFAPSVREDSRAIWFDLETLKAFIYQIELKANKNKPPAYNTELGIRIYYANYPDYQNWGNYTDLPGTGSNVLPQDYEKRHTLVMIPTIRKGDLNVDFNPLDPVTYSDLLLPNNEEYSVESDLETLALTGIPSSGPISRSTGAQNHGNLYPPLGSLGLGF